MAPTAAAAATRPPGGSPLALSVLGGFSLLADGAPVRLSASAQRLVALVALHRRPVPRRTVAGTLWCETPDDKGAANLRAALRRLPRPDGLPLLACDGPSLALPPASSVDLWSVDDDLAHLPDPRVPDGTRRTPAGVDVALLEHDVLPAWEDDWVLLERERHRQRRLHALERLCGVRRREGRFDEALAFGLAAVRGEPLRESAHRRVIEVHLAEGNAAEALRQYEGYRRALRLGLGLPPSPAMRRLVGDLLGRPVERAGAGGPT